MHAPRSLFAVLATAALVAAQQTRQDAPDTLRVVMTTKVAGKPVARLDANDKETGSRRWTDRVIEWQFGGNTFAASASARRALARIAKDPASLRESPDQPGHKELLPIVIEPDAGVCWAELLTCFDVANEAGFPDWRLLGFDGCYVVPKSVEVPVLEGGALILPRAVFNEPDDAPAAGRPVFRVRQDGTVVRDGRTLFRWRAGEPDDLTTLKNELLEIRAQMQKAEKLRKRGPDAAEVIDVPVLVCADKWCEWRDVRRLLQTLCAPEIGFWKLEFGVADLEMEPGDKDFGKMR